MGRTAVRPYTSIHAQGLGDGGCPERPARGSPRLPLAVLSKTLYLAGSECCQLACRGTICPRYRCGWGQVRQLLEGIAIVAACFLDATHLSPNICHTEHPRHKSPIKIDHPAVFVQGFVKLGFVLIDLCQGVMGFNGERVNFEG